MKKVLLLLLFVCSMAARAQFVNPYVYNTDWGFSYTMSVQFLKNENSMPQDLPNDTIVNGGWISFGLTAVYIAPDVDKSMPDSISRHFDISLKDYYKRNIQGHELPGLDVTVHTYVEKEIFNDAALMDSEIGGHYDWCWSDSFSTTQSGHVQINVPAKNYVTGLNGNSDKLIEYNKLDIVSRINTGFPYDIADYTGVAKYTVYDPDSVLICQKEIELRISPDSLMNGQIQKDIICSVDSARHGEYHIQMEAPFLKEPQQWVITVEDPLAKASSRNPVDATYRLRERNFKNNGKGNGWKLMGSVKPTYYNDMEAGEKLTAMVVRSDENNNKGNGFSLTQSVSKMPSGFYTLTWPVAYQPCSFEEMEGNEYILAETEANGYTAKAKHIMADARTTKVSEDGEEYVSITLPKSDGALAKRMCNADKYTTKLGFYVGEDSLVNIGLHKSQSMLQDEMTAIGAVTLTYYGAGLPYGDVEFSADSIFCAGDNLSVSVNLHNGAAKDVDKSNIIELFVYKFTEENIDTENPVIHKTLSASEEGDYKVDLMLEGDKEKLQSGIYGVMVRSLKEGEDYELVERKVIQVTTNDAIDDVRNDANISASSIYNLSGMKLATENQAKGIYIKDGKKQTR